MAEADIIWSCALTPLDKPLHDFTVGTLYQLECQGPDINPLGPSSQISFPKEEDSYSLQVLKVVEAQAGNAKFIVTGYKPGQYKPEVVYLGDGQSKVEIHNLEWKVNSVLQGNTAASQPFGPLGPWGMSYPLWVWGGLGLLFLMIVWILFWRIRKRRARMRLLERLRASASALSPYNQFHKEMRNLMRKRQNLSSPAEYVDNLEDSFRTYLTCELLVPAQEWGDAALLREIKKRHRQIYKVSATSVRALLAELERAKKSKQLSLTDCEQLHEISRRVVDEINTSRQQVSR